jgi:hypothetical protein
MKKDENKSSGHTIDIGKLKKIIEKQNDEISYIKKVYKAISKVAEKTERINEKSLLLELEQQFNQK